MDQRLTPKVHCLWKYSSLQRAIGLTTAVIPRAACSNSRPPPLQTPQSFEPVFLQFEILGERVGAKGAEVFFFLRS